MGCASPQLLRGRIRDFTETRCPGSSDGVLAGSSRRRSQQPSGVNHRWLWGERRSFFNLDLSSFAKRRNVVSSLIATRAVLERPFCRKLGGIER